MTPFSAALPASLCLTAVALAGCASEPLATAPADPGIDPPPMPSSDERAEVERSYRDFWRITWNTTADRSAEWDAEVRQVASQEMADQITTRARDQLASGVRLYGAVVAHVTAVEITGNRASVQDCQDTSRAGQADAISGEPKNVGVQRNPVRATLSKGTDSRWRVDRIEFPGGEC
ncbi:hypothetical protein F1721_32955 [Saccharopolyspora hirsuta]|uniref:Secreted protein/lipoprotein n=1 Tax=Saccharopolyspora hirsuta TaxID=1837 RepID=A0A5M7BB10_SACHI|nr:hypothetical protein [Saccharopolyspora hirsuta]KAA5825447.1 hypothetical protein F1721_32955 [Saccharopolyspora hirsuta]